MRLVESHNSRRSKIEGIPGKDVIKETQTMEPELRRGACRETHKVGWGNWP